MCSSPKSSGQQKPKTPPMKGVFAELSHTSRDHFTAIANAADERRLKRKESIQAKKEAAIRSLAAQAKPANKKRSAVSLTLPAWIFRKDLLALFKK